MWPRILSFVLLRAGQMFPSGLGCRERKKLMSKNTKRFLALIALTTMLLALMMVGQGLADNGLSDQEHLGKFLYEDTTLSTPDGQSCESCHHPAAGFADPDSDLPVSQGVLPKNRFGNRNSPSSAYAMFSPVFHFDQVEELWIGGQFWDGRATGEVLGDPLADQALGPFLNPLEMNNPDKRTVINDIKNSDYADLFVEVCGGTFGKRIFKNVEEAYDCVALSIASFERTAAFAEFSSKYDAYLAEEIELTDQEKSGLELFEGTAMCSACHISEPGPNDEPPLFTDFTYDNLGVPKNPDNPFYYLPSPFNPDGVDFVDLGLGGFLQSAGYPLEVYEPEMGKVKVMTLRNIADTGPYMHNGVFATLEEVVHFYNTRDVESWPPPEVPENVNTDELGDLGLTSDEEAAIVAFLMTLSDGWLP